jgi:hypothetical protein
MRAVDEFIRDICISIDDPDARTYNKQILSMARGLRKLNLQYTPVYRSENVNLNPLNMLDWPIDCIQVINVWLARYNNLYRLSKDQNLQSRSVYKEYLGAKSVDYAVYDIDNFFPYYTGVWNFTGELFGVTDPGNSWGYYNHIHHERSTVLSGSYQPNDTFVLSFKYDPTFSGLQWIPDQYEFALRNYCLYEHYLIKNPGVSARCLKEYNRESEWIRNFMGSGNEKDYIDILTSNYKSNPK